MDNYNYQSETVIDFLPQKADLSEQLLLSSDVKERRYNEFIPINSQSVAGINSTGLNFVSQFRISSVSEWLDLQTANLCFTVGNIVLPAGSAANTVVLDGKYACIDKVTMQVGTSDVVSSNNAVNKHANIKHLNESFTANYLSDALLCGGDAKLCSVLTSSAPPTSASFYGSLGASPQNLLPATNTGIAGSLTVDVNGVLIPNVPARQVGYGYRNSSMQTKGMQSVSIPMAELVSFFAIDKYFPLFLSGEVLINIYWASPVTSFWSDVGVYTAAVAGPPAVPASFVPSSISSYDVTGIKITADMLTCSESLNNSYRLKAMSEEGLNLVYDDILVLVGVPTPFTGSQKTMSANLSTASLKSCLFYTQPVQNNVQNSWSNSHMAYLGLSGFSMNLNNKQTPQLPLQTPMDFAMFNLKNKGVNANQLSNFVSSNPYVFCASEVAPAGTASNGDIVPAVTCFMVYSNFEKILNENMQIVRNGVNLKDGNSSIAVTWNENPDVGAIATAIREAVLGAKNSYQPYLQCTYQRVLRFANGTVQPIG